MVTTGAEIAVPKLNACEHARKAQENEQLVLNFPLNSSAPLSEAFCFGPNDVVVATESTEEVLVVNATSPPTEEASQDVQEAPKAHQAQEAVVAQETVEA